MGRVKVPTLETPRLVLRGWRRRDAAALFAYARSPNVGPNAGWKPHSSVHESRQIITQMFWQHATWAITVKADSGICPATPAAGGADSLWVGSRGGADGSLRGDNRGAAGADVPIGSIGFELDALRPGLKSRELGYSLSEDYWGQGIMTEAARRLLQYGFETLGLDSVMIRTGTTNERSQRVIDKCGFHYEGTLRRCYQMYNGALRDSRVYSMLRAEYEELRGALQPDLESGQEM